MIYATCQTPNCGRTYPVARLDTHAKNLYCETCGGVVVDGNGQANLTKYPWVSPDNTMRLLEKKRKLEDKQKALYELQSEIYNLEKEIKHIKNG